MNPIINSLPESKIYLHENVKLRNGGRNAVMLSINDFKAILNNIKKKNDIDDEDSFYWIRDLMYEGMFDKLQKDLSKVDIDFENFEIKENIKMSEKGFPYLEGICGGDWQIPIKFYIYWDGKDLRGYIPTKGNTFNSKTKEAFSCESCNNDEDGYYIVKDVCPQLIKQYSKQEIIDFMKDFDYTKIEINNNWCLEDFENRMILKNYR